MDGRRKDQATLHNMWKTKPGQQQEPKFITTGEDANLSKQDQIKKFRARLFLLRQEEAKRWIQEVLEDLSLFDDMDSTSDFIDKLRDGTILCRLAESFVKSTGKNFRYHKNVVKGSTMEFMKATDNINQFFSACKDVDFPQTYLFTLPDLWDRRNITTVVHCIHALAHYLSKTGYSNVTIKDLSKMNIQFHDHEIERVEKEFEQLEQDNHQINLDFNFGITGNDEDDFGNFEDGGFDFSETETPFIPEEDTYAPSIDASKCLIDGNGSRMATAGEYTTFTILCNNSNGDPVDVPNAENLFEVLITDPKDEFSEVHQGIVTYKGNGRYEVGYKLFHAGEYQLSIKFSESSFTGSPYLLKVVPGKLSAQHCRAIHDEALHYKQYFEGQKYTYQLLCSDEFGNIRNRGGDKIKAQLQLKQSKYVPKNAMATLSLDDATLVLDQNNGTYNILFRPPIPGKYILSVKGGDALISLPGDGHEMDVVEQPFPQCKITFEPCNAGNSVIQFALQTISPLNSQLVSDPKYICIVYENASKIALSPQHKKQLEEVMVQEMQQWISKARENRAQQLSAKNEVDSGHLFDDEEEGNRNFYWNLLDCIDDEVKCNQLKEAFSKKFKWEPSNKIDYVTISDELMDWREYEQMKLLEMQNKLKAQQQTQPILSPRVQVQLPPPTTPPVPGYDPNLYNPNKFTIKPRLSALNFWVILSHMINQAKSTGGYIIDTHNMIRQYETNDIMVRQFANPDAINCTRKRDIKQYIDLLLLVAQRYIFELLDELEKQLKDDFSFVKPDFMNVAKLVFEELKQVHVVADIAIKENWVVAGDNLNAEVDKSMRKQAKILISSLIRKFCIVLRDDVILRFKEVLKSKLGLADDKLNNMAISSTFFKLQLVQIGNGFSQCMSYTLSAQDRKILVQELVFKTPYRNKFNQILTSSSFAIQIPMNALFDGAIYNGNRRWCRSSKDRARPGLVNAYKSCFVKDGVVMWEALRSGVLSAVDYPIESKERSEVSLENALELLRCIAANHVKRFTRQELNQLILRREPLQVPFTSISLLTPFFINNREDLQLMEHQTCILEAVRRALLQDVTVDLHDGQVPITMPIRFTDVCLLNFGTNMVIKTFRCGIGIQRAINNRSCGFRVFEKKVQHFLKELSLYKHQLRLLINKYLSEVVFTLPRTGMMYARTLGQRAQQIDLAYSNELKSEEEISKQIMILDYELQVKQKDLEHRIKTKWFPKFKDVTSVEFIYQTKIKNIVNDIDKNHTKIFNLENAKVSTKVDDLLDLEDMFIKEMSSLLNQTAELANRPLPCWNEYVQMQTKFKDIWILFQDCRKLYHSNAHESFTQNVIETGEVAEIDPYAVPVRVLVLSFMIGEQTHFNCKSGKDRTGECQDQVQEFSEMRSQFGEYPNSRQEKHKFNDHRRMLHTVIALNSGGLDIIRANLGMPGSKTDASVSGRFLPGFYQKYKGLSKLDKAPMATSDTYWNELCSRCLKST